MPQGRASLRVLRRQRCGIDRARWRETQRHQAHLGLMYNQGQGIPQDLIRAHMWYNIAAAAVAGDVGRRSKNSRDRLALQMTAAQIEKAQEMARRCQESKFKECD